MFPISLSHFLLSFARLLFSLPPEALVGLQCTFALLKGITSSLAQRLKGLMHIAKLNYHPLASFPHGVPPHRCDLTRSLTKKKRKEKKASFCDLRCFHEFYHLCLVEHSVFVVPIWSQKLLRCSSNTPPNTTEVFSETSSLLTDRGGLVVT